MKSLEIRLLGAFRVSIDGHVIPDRAWRHRRGADLVKLLALANDHTIHRERVMDALWPGLGDEAAAINLRKALHHARRALGSEQAIGRAGDMITLWPGGQLTVDAVRFEAAARRARDEEAIAAVIALYGGELLPEDRYAPWATARREYLRLCMLDLLKRGARWDEVLEMDPADETAHRALMERALASGDRRAALRQFERLREQLRADVGAGPSDASVKMYERALEMDAREPPTVAERARALIARGIVHLNSGDLEEAEAVAKRARALAIDAELPREMGEASALVGIAAHMCGRWKDLFRVEFLASIGRPPAIASPVFDANLCLAELCMSGPAGHEGMVEYARELLALAEKGGSIQGRAVAELLLGEADLFSDRLPSAERHLEAAVVLYDRAHALSGRVVAIQRLAELAIARRQRWRARRMLRPAFQLAQRAPFAPHLLVRLHAVMIAAAANDAAAVRTIWDADRALSRGSVCPPCSIGIRLAAVVALARAGALDHARRRIEESERMAAMWPGGAWHAALWEARAVLREAEGDREQAAALYREAADRFAAVHRPRDEARCRARP